MVLLDEWRTAWADESRGHRVALVALILIAFLLRLAHLTQPMRYDESVTYLYFVSRSWADALSLYTYPNNHLFHSLLAKVSIAILGDTPWSLRLPAFAAGVLLVPASYGAVRALYGGTVALFATAIVASSGALTLYSTSARGYSIVGLAFLVLVVSGARILRGTAAWATFVIAAWLGLWTIPIMLYPLGSVCLWMTLVLLLEKRIPDVRRLGWALATVAALTGLVYAPVVAREGLAAILRNRFVAPMGWYEFLQELPGTIREALASWRLGMPWIVAAGLAACVAVALRHHRRMSRWAVGLPLAAFAWCAWLLVVGHRAPFPRVWLWFHPIVAALAGAGVVDLLSRARRGPELLARSPAMAVVFAAAAALTVYRSRAVFLSLDTGTFRDARAAALDIGRLARDGDRVIVPIPENAPLLYALDRRAVPATLLTLDERRANRVFVIVDAAEGHTLESVTSRSAVRDTTQFGGPVLVARYPSAFLFEFQRRNVATR